MSTSRRIVVVGSGLIGESLAADLRARGAAVTTVARRARVGPHVAADLATSDGLQSLRELLSGLQPECTVLVHGPSDVSWIEQHEAEARAAHVGAAAAAAGHRVLLVSTDNVFDGSRGMVTDDQPAAPRNAYGRVKLAAEQAVHAGCARSTVVRVSLVYGWADDEHRLTYAQRCLQAAERREPMAAPLDQMFTPVHADDVVTALAALALSELPPPRLLHLAGPQELSRYEFARLACRIAGVDPALVTGVPRAQTEWACRPRYSSLRSSRGPAWWQWRPATPDEGIARMVTSRPAGARHPR